MTVAIVTEGRMALDFTAAVKVERLDLPSRPLPHGMALVDFVVDESAKTLLVEIKDPEGAPEPHRARAIKDFLKKTSGDSLIHQEIVPKARDSYTFLHLMGRDEKPFVLVCLLGLPTSDAAILGNFKNRLLARLRKETVKPWVRQYVKDCVVVTPATWTRVFPDYPLKVV